MDEVTDIAYIQAMSEAFLAVATNSDAIKFNY